MNSFDVFVIKGFTVENNLISAQTKLESVPLCFEHDIPISLNPLRLSL